MDFNQKLQETSDWVGGLQNTGVHGVHPAKTNLEAKNCSCSPNKKAAGSPLTLQGVEFQSKTKNCHYPSPGCSMVLEYFTYI